MVSSFNAVVKKEGLAIEVTEDAVDYENKQNSPPSGAKASTDPLPSLPACKKVKLSNAEELPKALSSVVATGSTYREKDEKANSSISIKSASDVDNAILNTIAPIFTESVIVFSSCSILITQFEVYYRNDKKIDDAAIPTPGEPYHDEPAAEMLRKTEKGNVWVEVSIFYHRFELLITGGILMQDGQVVPFLGPNVPLASITSATEKTTKKLWIKEGGAPSVLRERSLRNRLKKVSAAYKWKVMSIQPSKEGETIQKYDCIDTVFAETEHQKLLDMVKASPKFKCNFEAFAELTNRLHKHRVDLDFLKVLCKLENNKRKKVRQVLKGKGITVAFSTKML